MNKQNQHEDALAWKHFRHNWPFVCMMTSSNGNIFRVTGPLCGEFTGPGEFPTQRSVTRSINVYFDLRPNKRLSKQSWGWWFETLSWCLWRHHNGEKSTNCRCKRPITHSFRVFFYVSLNKLLNKQLTLLTEPFNKSLGIQVIFAIARVRSFVRQGFPTIILKSIHPMIFPFKFGICVHIHYLGEFSEIISRFFFFFFFFLRGGGRIGSSNVGPPVAKNENCWNLNSPIVIQKTYHQFTSNLWVYTCRISLQKWFGFMYIMVW